MIRSGATLLVWHDRNPSTGEVVAVPLAGGVEFWGGKRRHEVFLVYDVELAARSLYAREHLDVVEDDGASYRARWRPLADFHGTTRLVPAGLLALVEGR